MEMPLFTIGPKRKGTTTSGKDLVGVDLAIAGERPRFSRGEYWKKMGYYEE